MNEFQRTVREAEWRVELARLRSSNETMARVFSQVAKLLDLGHQWTYSQLLAELEVRLGVPQDGLDGAEASGEEDSGSAQP